jgi:hypothetical protein
VELRFGCVAREQPVGAEEGECARRMS